MRDGAVILVGIRQDGAERDRNWAHNRAHWEQLGLPIYEGESPDGPFNMAAASNDAARRAGEWLVALYVGADFICPLEQAVAAINRAWQTGKLVFAHNHLVLLDEQETEWLTSGDDIEPGGHRHPNTFSGVLAFRRELYEAIGGFDERFVGWGGEDIAFMAACGAIGGGCYRVRGDHWHLWHPRPDEHHEHYPANDELMRRYLALQGNRHGMLDLLAERR